MLYLSTTTEYGLNLLIALAKAQSRISLKEVANKTGMPYRFLTKIAKPLIVAKLIKAKEGKNGGYSLSREPGKIRLKYILDSLDEPLSIAICLSAKSCPLKKERNCKVKTVWTKIKRNIDKELNRITLKDLI